MSRGSLLRSIPFLLILNFMEAPREVASLKWARFVCLFVCLFFVCLSVCVSCYCLGRRLPVFMLIGWRATKMPLTCENSGASCHQCHLAKNEMMTSGVCFACLTWLCGLFVRTLIWRTSAYAGSGRPTLNFIERLDLGRSIPTAKSLHLVSFGR